MLHTSILVLQYTIYTTAATLPKLTYYWKTTDPVPDYFNHGPVRIPRRHDVFMVTTKPPHIPTWSSNITSVEFVAPIIIRPVWFPRNLSSFDDLVMVLPELNSDTISSEENDTLILVEPISSTTASENTKSKTSTTCIKPHNGTATEKTKKTGSTVIGKGATEPFSVILKKMFKSLAGKSYHLLPVLLKPFAEHVEKYVIVTRDYPRGTLLSKNQQFFGNLVPFVISFVNNLTSLTPEVLHIKCYRVSSTLSNSSALEGDVISLLTTLDHLHTKSEEAAMQRALLDLIEFPNKYKNKSAESIVEDLISSVILMPMQRISGTPQRDTLLIMLRDVLEKRGLTSLRADNQKEKHRPYSGEVRHKRHKTIASPLKELKFDKKYKNIRNNIEDIHSLLREVKVFSSETNEYESLSISESSEENVINGKDNTTVHRPHGFRKDKNSLIYVAKPIESETYSIEEYSKRDHFINILSKYDMTPRANQNYRRDKKRIANPTKLLPDWPLTRIVKDFVGKEEPGKQLNNFIASQNKYFKEKGKNMVTKSVKEVNNQIPLKPPFEFSTSSNYRSTKLYGKPESLNQQHSRNTTHLFTKYNTTSGSYAFEDTLRRRDKHKAIGGQNINGHKEFNELVDRQQFSLKNAVKVKGFWHQKKEKSRDKEKIYSSEGRTKNKKHETSRNHKHRHKYKKRKHKHGHGHNGKCKKLKHKYHHLKQILVQKFHNREYNDSNVVVTNNKHGDLRMGRLPGLNINTNYNTELQKVTTAFSRTKLNVDNINSGKVNTQLRYPSPKKNGTRNFGITAFTTKLVKQDLRSMPAVNFGLRSKTPTVVTPGNVVQKKTQDRRINMLLNDDYDNYNSKGNVIKQKTPWRKINVTVSYKTPYRRILSGEKITMKSRPYKLTIDEIFNASSEYSDTEQELKEKIDDSFRHVDFNMSRRTYHLDKKPIFQFEDTEETDVEAMLKRNIYKAINHLNNL